MLVVTIYDEGGQQKFAVHDCDGQSEPVNITDQYEVRQLAVEDEAGELVAGWHVGRRVQHEDVLEALPYGRCPRCGEPGRSRERRPDGNDVCRAGHTYPSREAVR